MASDLVSLADCPVGLFRSASGELCLKTEYGNNEGRIDAYIVSSGEFFWGSAPQTIASQRSQMVQPADPDAENARLREALTDDIRELQASLMLQSKANVDLAIENKRLREALTEAHHAVRVYAGHISHLTRDDLKRAGAVSAALNGEPRDPAG